MPTEREGPDRPFIRRRRQAGQFDRRLEIQQKIAVAEEGGFGDEQVTWVTVSRPWARREVPRTARSSEIHVAEQFAAQVDAIFELRHPVTDVDSDMRVVDGTRVYDITAILEAERMGGGQELQCFTHRD